MSKGDLTSSTRMSVIGSDSSSPDFSHFVGNLHLTSKEAELSFLSFTGPVYIVDGFAGFFSGGEGHFEGKPFSPHSRTRHLGIFFACEKPPSTVLSIRPG